MHPSPGQRAKGAKSAFQPEWWVHIVAESSDRGEMLCKGVVAEISQLPFFTREKIKLQTYKPTPVLLPTWLQLTW